MTARAQVDVTFLSPEEGGREQMPTGPTYATVARFEALAAGEHCQPLSEPWSLVIEFGDVCASERRAWGTARLLAPEAASLLAHSGRRFVLLEGARVVARGLVFVGAEGSRR